MRIFLWTYATLLSLLLSPRSLADEVRYLAQPLDALAAFVSLAEEARVSLDLTTFILEPCDASVQLLLEVLARKADQGVRVRVILDDLMQSGARKQLLADFGARHGIEFRFYNIFEKNMRTHSKLMVVDSESYISGGRNLSDEYFALSPEKNFIDRDLLVRGASARQAADSFQELWVARLASRKVGAGSRFPGWSQSCGPGVAAKVEAVRSFLRRNGDLLDRVPARECSSVRFISDNPDFGHASYGGREFGEEPDDYMNPVRLRQKRATNYMLGFVSQSRSSLLMENWVYMPIYKLSDSIAAARNRGVVIRGLTNADTESGPTILREAIDYAVEVFSRRHSVGTQRVSRISSRGGMSAAHELSPEGSLFHLHGKVFIRDRQDLVVGSFNLDSRSYNTNLESLVAVTACPQLAADAEEHLEALFLVHEEDLATGRVPPKKPPSFWAKLFANAALIFF
jgi:cardiolipin synthase C